MTYTNLLAEIVTIFNRTDAVVDRYGNPTDAWGSGVQVAGRVEQVATTEDLNGRDTRVSEFMLFLPAGTNISALSEVEVAGERYRVTGDPAFVFDASAVHHIEAGITRITGG